LKMIEMPTVSTKLLLEQVSGLPSHTIVFFHLIPQESSQTEIGTYDVLAAIAQRFPTYCFHPYCLSHGAVGGSYTDQTVSGVKGERWPPAYSRARDRRIFQSTKI